jgi:hypothetical protein
VAWLASSAHLEHAQRGDHDGAACDLDRRHPLAEYDRAQHRGEQRFKHHPHVHTVVPGLSPDATRWIAGRSHFFLPVKVLSTQFRRRESGGRVHGADSWIASRRKERRSQ